MFIKFFTFTRSEQKGIIVLFVLLLVLIVIRLLLPHYLMQDHKYNISSYEEYFSNLNDSLMQSRVKKNTVFQFSLKSVTSEEMEMLGFNKFQRHNVIAYRNAGGKFYSIADFHKIYGVDSILVSRLEGYVLFDTPKISTKESVRSIDLNKASVDDLLKIKGLGSLYANRIVKFRNALGGFYSIDQLDEVYGLKEGLRRKVKASFFVLADGVQQIDLKTTNVYKLRRHAYLNNSQAKQLLEIYYRDKNCIDTIVLYKQLRQNDLGKIIPYLSCDQVFEN